MISQRWKPKIGQYWVIGGRPEMRDECYSLDDVIKQSKEERGGMAQLAEISGRLGARFND